MKHFAALAALLSLVATARSESYDLIIRHGRVVRLKQGDYGQQINYDVDPIAVAKSYQDAGATWFHWLGLTPAFTAVATRDGTLFFSSPHPR